MDKVAEMEVDKVADMVTDMEFDMVADMEVDKVANMEVDLVADIVADINININIGIDIDINMEIQFGERVGHNSQGLIGPKLLRPKAYLAGQLAHLQSFASLFWNLSLDPLNDFADNKPFYLDLSKPHLLSHSNVDQKNTTWYNMLVAYLPIIA